MKLAKYEHKRAKLPPPKFFPLAVSSFGEWSGSLFDFVNDATKHFSSYAAFMVSEGHFTDALPMPKRRSRFRSAIKNAIACQVLGSLGRLMLTAGDPVQLPNFPV